MFLIKPIKTIINVNHLHLLLNNPHPNIYHSQNIMHNLKINKLHSIHYHLPLQIIIHHNYYVNAVISIYLINKDNKISKLEDI